MEKAEENIIPFIINNKKNMRFEVLLDDGSYAFLEYRYQHEILVLMHTYVPEDKENQGIASQLSHFVLEYAKSNALKIKVYCPFVTAYLTKHPEYSFLLA